MQLVLQFGWRRLVPVGRARPIGERHDAFAEFDLGRHDVEAGQPPDPFWGQRVADFDREILSVSVGVNDLRNPTPPAIEPDTSGGGPVPDALRNLTLEPVGFDREAIAQTALDNLPVNSSSAAHRPKRKESIRRRRSSPSRALGQGQRARCFCRGMPWRCPSKTTGSMWL